MSGAMARTLKLFLVSSRDGLILFFPLFTLGLLLFILELLLPSVRAVSVEGLSIDRRRLQRLRAGFF